MAGMFNKTEKMFFKGKLSWCKLTKPDDWGSWNVTMHPDTESLEAIRTLQGEGLKNVLKKDEDGYFIKFRRPCQRMIKGKVIGVTPPEVVDDKGEPLIGHVGNGSDGVVKLEVYEHNTPGGGKAKAARLEAVKVVNLVPYDPEKDMDDAAKAKVEGLGQQEMFF